MVFRSLVAKLKEVAGIKARNYDNDHVVYAIGDIHGYSDALKNILSSIKSDYVKRRASTPALTAEIVFTGDFVSRGPDSRGVIETLCLQKMAQDNDGIKRVFLFGNHDYLTLGYLTSEDPVKRHKMIPDLINFGILQTAASYGVLVNHGNPEKDKNAILLKYKNVAVTPQNLERFHDAFRQAIPQHHMSFLKSLKVAHVNPLAPDFFFCHAGVDWTKPISDQDKNVMLGIGTWEEQQLSRQFAKHTNGANDAIVVHGHTILPEVDVKSGRVSIDTGIYGLNGKLSCVILSGREVLGILQAKTKFSPYDKKVLPKKSDQSGSKSEQNMSHPMDAGPQ